MPDAARRVISNLIGARSLNTFGRQVISATVLWELYARTNNSLVIGGVGLVQVIPVVLLFIPSGNLVDRYDRRWLATLAVSATALIGLGLAAASLYHAPIAAYFALLFCNGCVTTIHAPSSSSLIPMLVPRSELTRVNRIGSSLQELAAIIGPAVAGLALAFIAPHFIYGAIAIAALTSAAMYRALPAPVIPEAKVTSTDNVRRDWRAGLRFIFNSPLLLPALTLDMFAVLFAGVTALLPVIAKDVLHVGSFGYGVLRAAQSAGAATMAVIASRLPAWQRPGHVLLIVVALFGVATMAFGLSHWFEVSVVLLFICGALDNVSVVIRLTLEQLVVPDAIRGRVSAVHYVFIGMSNELGAAESGFAAGLVGAVPAIVGGGAIAIAVVGFVAYKWRALAAMPPLAELQPDTR